MTLKLPVPRRGPDALALTRWSPTRDLYMSIHYSNLIHYVVRGHSAQMCGYACLRFTKYLPNAITRSHSQINSSRQHFTPHSRTSLFISEIYTLCKFHERCHEIRKRVHSLYYIVLIVATNVQTPDIVAHKHRDLVQISPYNRRHENTEIRKRS